MTEIFRNCLNCEYSIEQQLVGPDGKVVINQKIHTCQRFPPTPVLLPNPPGGASLAPCFPIVNKGISCAEHQFKPDEDTESDNVKRDLQVN